MERLAGFSIFVFLCIILVSVISDAEQEDEEKYWGNKNETETNNNSVHLPKKVEALKKSKKSCRESWDVLHFSTSYSWIVILTWNPRRSFFPAKSLKSHPLQRICFFYWISCCSCKSCVDSLCVSLIVVSDFLLACNRFSWSTSDFFLVFFS